MTPQDIEAQAKAELEAEEHRAAVEAAKQHIREKRAAQRWWHALFPYTIEIKRRT